MVDTALHSEHYISFDAEIPYVNSARLASGAFQPCNPNLIQSHPTQFSDISCNSDYTENTNLEVNDNMQAFVNNFIDM